MALTPTSLLSCLVSSALLTALAWAIVKNDSALKMAGRQIGIFLVVIVARLMLPVEFGFTVTVLSRRLLTGLRNMMLSMVSIGAIETTVGQILLFLWAVGVICIFFIHTVRYIHLIYIIGKHPSYYRHDVGAVIDKINREYGKNGTFKVLLVPGIQTPAIFGLVHPKILMPMTNYVEKDIYYILKHEMLHYYHHDMLVKALCGILCTIYWWNPAVFLLKKLIERVVEIRVDSILTSGFSEEEKTSYLECIVKSIRAGKQGKADLMITFAAQKGEAMNQRFHCIYENYWQGKGQKGFLVVAFSCLLFLASVSFIVEPDYGGDIPGTFDCPEPETSYLLEKDGRYKIYVDGELVGEVIEITEPLTELRIYKNEEDINNEE